LQTFEATLLKAPERLLTRKLLRKENKRHNKQPRQAKLVLLGDEYFCDFPLLSMRGCSVILGLWC